MPTATGPGLSLRLLDRTGRAAVRRLEEVGMGAAVVAESLFWLFLGPRQRQPVRPSAVTQQMMEIGIHAIPILTVLAATIGVMLAIQGIHTLRSFGAESRVTIGVALSMVREFAPLITGILVAGRSGSALAARLGTMKINQEIDALRVMGINPVRFLVAPALFGSVVMVPCLAFYAGAIGIWAAGIYVSAELGMNMSAYLTEIRAILSQNDVGHGLAKSAIFGVLIAAIGVVNGTLVTGGAEGVGRYTTRAVVQSIAAIVVTDMLFVFVVTR